MNLRATPPIVVLAGLLVGALHPYAQVARDAVQLPPRDPRAAVPTGTATITGRVVDGATGSAVVRAIVRLSGGGAPGGQRPSVATDDTGVFTFVSLPAGSYSIAVEKATYLPTRYPEGGKTFRTQITQLTLANGQTMDGITIRMYRGGVITGRVVDIRGEPVEYSDVRAMRISSTGARPSVMSQSNVNDIGEFRVARLAPGTYVVMATPRRINTDDPFDVQNIPTYYPGVPSIEQAQPIVINRNTTVAGVEIMLLEGATVVVSGTVIGPDGQPLRNSGYLNARRVVKDQAFADMGGGAQVRPGGAFEMRLSSGDYDLEGGFMQAPFSGPGPMPMENQLWASTRISVGNQPMGGLVVIAGRGATVTGKIVFDGTSAPPPNMAQWQVNFSGQNGPGCRSGRSETAADGSFKVEGVSGTCIARISTGAGGWTAKGVMYDRKNLMDEPFTFESGQQIRDVQAIFSDKRTEVTFSVTDDSGQPTREYVVLMFPADESRWTRELVGRYVRTYTPQQTPMGMVGRGIITPTVTGNVVGVTPGVTVTLPNGVVPSAVNTGMRRDTISGMPAGEYYAIALDDLETDFARDAASFERLKSGAQRVTELQLHRMKLDR
jgi:hypothetical protein